MNEIKLDNHTYEIPSCYEELSAKQLTDISRLLLFYHSSETHTKMEWRYMREEALKILMDFQRGVVMHSKSVRDFIHMPAAERIALITHDDILPWIWEKPQITANIIKSIEVNDRIWIAPHQSMCDVSAEEFVDNHIVSMLYGMTQEEKWLDKLIASLYRPSVRDVSAGVGKWDWREPNDAKAQEEREALVATEVKPELKMAIWLQYTGHLDEFTSDKPKFFSAVKKEEGEESTPDLQGYQQMILKMSGQQFGDYSQTAKAKAEPFFRQIEFNITAREEQERENRRK